MSAWSSDVCSSDLHQHVGAGNIAGLMTDENLRTEALQPIGTGGFLEVRARHLVAEIEQHPGAAAHADPADTHEVNATSEARRVGTECVSTCRSRWSPDT